MGNLSNDQGRAFEYATLLTFYNEIGKIRKCDIVINSSFYAAENAWHNVPIGLQKDLSLAAEAAVDSIFDLEPMILEKGNDIVQLFIQPDSQGEEGDVRDILIVRRDARWEIGLSLKHNHFAVKHSRLAKNLDFGSRWFGIPCSRMYWNAVAPIFNYLEKAKQQGLAWRDLPDKENDVYVPLLEAFMDEVIRSSKYDSRVPIRMVEYLLGEYDFYKVIGVDTQRITQILTFNLRGTLNQSSRTERPKTIIPITNLPTRIVNIGFKPGSNNTVELYMDKGWQFSFRIHNASTKVETSLKFDIQIIGMPTTIIVINCRWRSI